MNRHLLLWWKLHQWCIQARAENQLKKRGPTRPRKRKGTADNIANDYPECYKPEANPLLMQLLNVSAFRCVYFIAKTVTVRSQSRIDAWNLRVSWSYAAFDAHSAENWNKLCSRLPTMSTNLPQTCFQPLLSVLPRCWILLMNAVHAVI